MVFGIMARPRKPTSQLEVQGAFEKNPNRARTGEPKAEGLPEKPKYLKGAAGKIWDQYAPLCVGMGTLAKVDSAEFATWCWLEAQFQTNPQAMTAAMLTQKRAYGERFGMSAGARAKLSVPSGDNQNDPADEFFNSAGPGSQLRQ